MMCCQNAVALPGKEWETVHKNGVVLRLSQVLLCVLTLFVRKGDGVDSVGGEDWLREGSLAYYTIPTQKAH